MINDREFKTLVNTSDLVNISPLMGQLRKSNIHCNSFKPLLNSEYFVNKVERFKNNSDNYSVPFVYLENQNEENQFQSDQILSLLLKIRACQNNRNDFIGGIGTIKRQIVDQLKRELLLRGSVFTSDQLDKIKELIEGNSHNISDFNELFASLSKSLKKKLDVNFVTNVGKNVKFYDLERNYGDFSADVLKRNKSEYMLGITLDLINRERVAGAIEIQEELRNKIFEKLKLVYSRDIENAVRDSINVLELESVSEEILNKLIENTNAIALEKEKYLKLTIAEKQKAVQEVILKELQKIYNTDEEEIIRESIRDTSKILERGKIEEEVLEKTAGQMNVGLDVSGVKNKQNVFSRLFGKKLSQFYMRSKERKLGANYGSFIDNILRRNKNENLVSTTLDFVNQNKVMDVFEIQEELRNKIFEKLRLVYSKDIENSVRDSVKVLGSERVSEEILNKLIENTNAIALEKEEYLKLTVAEKQKAVQEVVLKELPKIYNTDEEEIVRESIRDTSKILERGKIEEEVLEKIARQMNIGLSVSGAENKQNIFSKLFGKKLSKFYIRSKERKLSESYGSFINNVLRKNQNEYMVNTTLDLANRNQAADVSEIQEELRGKIFEKLKLIYSRDTENAIRDSIKVLESERVSEEILNWLIDNTNVIALEKEKYLKLTIAEKQKAVQKVVLKELQKIYNTDEEEIIRESIRDTNKILTQEGIEEEVLEKIAGQMNVGLNVSGVENKQKIFGKLFGKKLSKFYMRSKERKLSESYGSFINNVLRRNQNEYMVNVTLDLVNRNQVADVSEIQEELRNKIFEKLSLVYSRDIENAIRDSVKVLGSERVSEEILNKLIENTNAIALEKEKYLRLTVAEKQKAVQEVILKELQKIYNTGKEKILRESIRDTNKVLTQEKIEKGILEKVAKQINIDLKMLNTGNKQNILQRIFGKKLSKHYEQKSGAEEGYSNFVKSVLRKNQSGHALNNNLGLVYDEFNVGVLQKVNEVYKVKSTKRFFKTSNKISRFAETNSIKSRNRFSYIDDLIYNFKVTYDGDKYFNGILKKHEITTTFESASSISVRNVLSHLTENFGLLSKKIRSVGLNNSMSDLNDFKKSYKSIGNVIEDNGYIFDKVHYNDSIESLNINSLSIDDMHSDFPVDYDKMIYKLPVKVVKHVSDGDKNAKDSEDVLESQVIDNVRVEEPIHNQSNFINENSEKLELETKKFLEKYMSSMNLDVNSISRKVMDQIEKMMKTERRRFGILK